MSVRRFRLTTAEFQRALELAAIDDRRWPYFRRHQWLIEHALVKDGEVLLVIEDDNAPRRAMDDLLR